MRIGRYLSIARLKLVWLCLLYCVSFSVNGWTIDRIAQSLQPHLYGDFAIGKEGRLILLPVVIQGNEFQFLLDTGACSCVFDISLRESLGEPRSATVVQTPAGQMSVQTYEWPSATLNRQSLKTDRPVMCMDLSELRRSTNKQIYGVIGMDVLKFNRLRVDFDRGTLRFVESLLLEDDLGERIPLDMSPEGRPYLAGLFSTGNVEPFLIDTGAHGNSLRPKLFDQLLEQDLIKAGGSFTSMTVSGKVNGGRGCLDSLTVGSIGLNGLRMARVGPNSLGVRYLSRFVVTFDFPDGAIYLRAGDHFSNVEPHASSGLALIWNDGQITVDSVKEDGAAAKSGVRPNDEIVWINGNRASDYDHFSLRQLLTSEAGERVSMRLLRDHRNIEVQIVLEGE